MSDRDERPPVGPPVGPELERRLRDALARHEPAGDDAPSPEALLDALAGRLPEEERVRLIDRASRTADGRRELATLRVALGAAESAWPESASLPERRSAEHASHPSHATHAPASPGAGRRVAWWLRPATAAAAAVLLATGLGGGMWWRMMHASPNAPAAADADPLRSGDAAAGVSLVTPEVAAAAGSPPVLAWRAVPGALRYDVEVLTAEGAVVHAASTRDTTLALPAAAVPAAGTAYEWWVRARTAEGARRSAAGRIRGR